METPNPSPQTSSSQPQTPASSPGGNGSSGLATNLASLLCYVLSFVTGIIFLVIEKKDQEVRFHAWQAVLLGIASFTFSLAISILSWIIASTLAFLSFFITFISFVVGIGFLVVWVLAMIKAYQGEHWLIPVIGPLAEQQLKKSS